MFLHGGLTHQKSREKSVIRESKKLDTIPLSCENTGEFSGDVMQFLPQNGTSPTDLMSLR